MTPLQPDTPLRTTKQFPLIVLREVNLALSISLNYFFFFVYLGRPPRGEARLVEFSPLSSSRRISPSRWSYWGVTGYILQAILAAGIIAVAVLGIIWRLGGKATGSIYKADYLLQAVLALAFLGKICLNVFLSPLTPRWKTARDYLPVITALSSRLGIVLASEFCGSFILIVFSVRGSSFSSRIHRSAFGQIPPSYAAIRANCAHHGFSLLRNG